MLATSLLTAVTACRTPQPETAQRAPEVTTAALRPTTDMPFDFIWQQHVTAKWNGRCESFDAVLQKKGDELLLMGLSPMGMPGFVLKWGPAGLRFQNRTSHRLPFGPAYIMADIQRAYFPWLPPPRADFDGTRRGRHEDLAITEVYHRGRLASRSFRRADRSAEGVVAITYRNWGDGHDAPRHVVLSNGWFGYRLEIETVSQQRLDQSPEQS